MGAEQSTLGYVPACSVAEEAARDARRLVVLDGRGAVHLQQCVLRDNEPGAGLDAVPCGSRSAACSTPRVHVQWPTTAPCPTHRLEVWGRDCRPATSALHIIPGSMM